MSTFRRLTLPPIHTLEHPLLAHRLPNPGRLKFEKAGTICVGITTAVAVMLTVDQATSRKATLSAGVVPQEEDPPVKFGKWDTRRRFAGVQRLNQR